MFKNLCAILLMLPLILYVSGSLLVYKLQLKAIKKEMRHDIATEAFHTDSLCTIAIPIVHGQPVCLGFELENDEEIKWNGSMYDIVSSHSTSDTIYYQCIEDVKETALVEKYAGYIAHAVHGKKHGHIKVFIAFFLVEKYIRLEAPPVITRTPRHMAGGVHIPLMFRGSVPPPPPWYC